MPKKIKDCYEEINTDFLNAIKEGDLDKVKILLLVGDKRGKADINYSENYGCPIDELFPNTRKPKDQAIAIACEKGHLEIVEFLLTSAELEKKSDIHAFNDGLLSFAIKNKNYHVAKFLLCSERLPEKANINGGGGGALSEALNNRNWEFATCIEMSLYELV